MRTVSALVLGLVVAAAAAPAFAGPIGSGLWLTEQVHRERTEAAKQAKVEAATPVQAEAAKTVEAPAKAAS